MILKQGVLSILLTFTVFASCGCSTPTKKEDTPPSQDTVSQNELKNTITTLTSRLDTLELKLTSLNDKFEITQNRVNNLSGYQKSKLTPIISTPTSQTGVPIEEIPTLKTNAESEFSLRNPMIESYRQALVLYQTKKYPESILAFSAFLEKYPDHPLAGSAQFYVGDSYLKQKEFKLALQEFNHVLVSYDRSRHVPETLKQMALAEDALQQTDEAAKHRHLLTSLFPQSPAASLTMLDEPPPTAPIESEPPKAETKE